MVMLTKAPTRFCKSHLCHSGAPLLLLLPRLVQITHIDVTDINWLQQKKQVGRTDNMTDHGMPST